MIPIFSLHVTGEPRPQGSMKAFVNKRTGKAVVVQGEKPKDWRNAIRAAMQIDVVPWCSASVWLRLTFYLAFPKSKVRKRGYQTDQIPDTRPDGDKLERAVWDALTSKIYADDSQITRWEGRKRYTVGPPGVLIEVFVDSLTDEERRLYGGGPMPT